MSGVSSTHHVLGIPHLLGQLWDGEGPVLLGAPRRQGRKAYHEEVKAGEGDQVYSKLPEIRVQLAREPEAACDTTHCSRDEMIKIAN